MLEKFATGQILERIRYENPWWKSGATDAFYLQLPKRAYFSQFQTLAKDRSIQRAVVLMGPRRVGKTVMLYHFVQQLLDEGVAPKQILFITVENPLFQQIGLDQLFALGREASGNNGEDEKWYLIFDEIQYLRDWDVHLKSLMESYRGAKIIVSGSAAATLQYKSKESGAGRFTDFMLPPLTFFEFITMQNREHLLQATVLPWGENNQRFYQATDLRQLNNEFINYINYGGYPEAIFSETVRNNPERFIRNDVIEKVLLRDLPSLYGITDIQELNALFTTIAYNSSNEFSLETLSNQSGTPKHIIKKYLDYLETSFLIKIVRRVDQAGKRFQRDNFFKIYLTNPSIRAALFAPLQPLDEALGQMTETAIYAQWLHRTSFRPWYARWSNGEVDMIGISSKNLKPIWALEIKWTDRYVSNPAELKSLLKFCQANKLSRAIVTSISHQVIKSHQDIDLYFIPASAYAFTVGANTLSVSNDWE